VWYLSPATFPRQVDFSCGLHPMAQAGESE